MVIKGIINEESKVCVSIYEDKIAKNAINLLRTPMNSENNNNFLLPIFDESKISKVFSSANNSFEMNNESKCNQDLSNINPQKIDSKAKNIKSLKFKDSSKESLSNSDILNGSSFK